MRTISATLKAAQEAVSVTPYVRIYINSVDYSAKLLELEHEETAYDERAFITLQNTDRALDAVDFNGQYLEIGYGCVTGVGNEYSNTPGLWVKNQQLLSREGELICQLYCEGMWSMLRELKVLILGVAPTYDGVYDGTHTVYEILDLLIQVASGFSLDALGSQEDTIIDTFKPVFDVNNMPYESAGQAIYRLISMTNCYLRAQASKAFKVIFPQAADTANEEYYSDQGHYFWKYIEKQNLLIPNKINVFCNQDHVTGDWDDLITGEALDQDEIDKYTEVLEPHQAAEITNQVDADARADAILTRVKAEAISGMALVPHDCRVELYDKVVIYDRRGT